MSIASAIEEVYSEISAACARAGRDPAEVTLVAVSKTVPVPLIREARAAGIRHLGENRVQEILAKKPELEDCGFTWHMIGSLQTNKVRLVLPHIHLLHSLDRENLAEEISRLRAAAPLPALVQVNTTGEPTKSGVAPENLEALIDRVRGLPGIDLRGLMTLGPLGGDEAGIRRAFALLRSLRDRLRLRHPDLAMNDLSMGMSGDFPLAVEEGATLIRVGSRIFGARPAPGPER